MFPERARLPLRGPVPVERVVRHDPLSAIRQLLGLSLHDVVNREAVKRRVADFYRITRRLQNEEWLRRREADFEV